MNRCVISIGILIALVALCVSSLLLLHRRSDRFVEQTQAVAQEFAAAEKERALSAYDELLEEWDHFRDIAGVFVDGSKLDSIRKILAGLRPLIEAQHPEVPSELARIRGLVEDVFREELPDWWHIL